MKQFANGHGSRMSQFANDPSLWMTQSQMQGFVLIRDGLGVRLEHFVWLPRLGWICKWLRAQMEWHNLIQRLQRWQLKIWHFIQITFFFRFWNSLLLGIWLRFEYWLYLQVACSCLGSITPYFGGYQGGFIGDYGCTILIGYWHNHSNLRRDCSLNPCWWQGDHSLNLGCQ